jgi:hypothetical protein
MAFTDEQIHALGEIGIEPALLHIVRGRDVHPYMVTCDAWTDGDHVVFVRASDDQVMRFLHYVGAEYDAPRSVGDMTVLGGLAAFDLQMFMRRRTG